MAENLAEGVPGTGRTASARGWLGRAGVGLGAGLGAGGAGIGGGSAEERAGSENWDSGRRGRAGGAGGVSGAGDIVTRVGTGVEGISRRSRSRANFGDSSCSSTTTIFALGPTGLRGVPPAGLRGGSNRFEGVACSARQVSQIIRPVGLLAPCSTRTQPAAWRAARAFLMVWGQQPRSSASRRLDGQQESLARAYSSKAAASTIAVRFPLRRGSLAARAAGRRRGFGLVLGPPGALSPVRSAGSRPVWSTGLWSSSRLLPLFPGTEPGLKRRGG